jgi:hypothetical protein
LCAKSRISWSRVAQQIEPEITMGKSKSTTKVEPWAEAKPYILGAANNVQGAYNANKDKIAGIAATVQGLIPSLVDRYNQGNPVVRAATAHAAEVLGGKYLGANPALQGMIDQTNADVRNQVGASLGTRGRTGGDSYFGVMARELAKNENNLRYSDYAAERDRMAQMAGQAPGLAAAEYAAISPVLAAAQAGTELPFAASNNYAQNIAALLGPYTTQTTTQRKSFLDMLQQGLSVAGDAAKLVGGMKAGSVSDARAKTDIRKIGELDDGLGIYIFRYRDGGRPKMGVMAQDVAEKRPWALGEPAGDYATVRYEAL